MDLGRPIKGRIKGEGVKAERKQISTRTRFEVFKRDLFACQYCGATPPKAVLHIDHITPASKGGSNDRDNLVTACDRCNLGKSAVPLSSVPQSLQDKAAEVAEREKQISGYNKIFQLRADRIEAEIWQVAAALERVERLEKYDRRRLQSIKIFLTKMPFHLVLDAAEIAANKWNYMGGTGFRYFCGICWSRIKEAEGG